MTTKTTTTPADRLHYTGDNDADRLLVEEPMALLIGFALDQQVSVQKAFSGPTELKRRIGTLDPLHIAHMDPEELAGVFRARPALHRYPAAMAQRIKALAAHVADEYAGDASRVWTHASDGRDLRARVAALPGFGEMKVNGMIGVLTKRLGVRPPGWEEVAPHYPTLGDVDSAAALEEYQAKKRAYKASLRERGETFDPRSREMPRR
ncbi:MAG: HhH-GPD-type base excision DNA repair protein [Candidatus Limnocylindria bacterium]